MEFLANRVTNAPHAAALQQADKCSPPYIQKLTDTLALSERT